MKRVLTIAGSDSCGGAGLQADLKTFTAFRVYGTCAVTAVTVQNTRGVRSVHPLPPALVAAQVAAVLEDIGADAVKTGMLACAETVRAVAGVLQRTPPSHLVVDPVLRASDGTVLLDGTGREALEEHLFPFCELFTPNIPEAAAFLDRTVETLADMREAAEALHRMGPRYVLLKGGHLEGNPVDLLFDGRRMVERYGRRTPPRHGTGCTLAAALAALLARGAGVVEALDGARDYLTRAMAAGPAIGGGLPPLNHAVPPPPGKRPEDEP